jgi:hypothetical protein
MAILELAEEENAQSYPLIFDAPISDFDDTKSKDFLNSIYNLKGQKIILINNFTKADDLKEDSQAMRVLMTEFSKVKKDKAFWLCLETPYVSGDQKTLNSLIKPLKLT